jgi:hypothetical protein
VTASVHNVCETLAGFSIVTRRNESQLMIHRATVRAFMPLLLVVTGAMPAVARDAAVTRSPLLETTVPARELPTALVLDAMASPAPATRTAAARAGRDGKEGS